MNIKHKSPATVRLSLECDGETTVTTWGEFLAANRLDRDVIRAVWRVVTRELPSVAIGDYDEIVHVSIAEGGAS